MTRSKPSLYASPVRSNVVSGPMEGHSVIARAIEPDRGATAKGQSWSWRLLRGTRDFRSEPERLANSHGLVERNSIQNEDFPIVSIVETITCRVRPALPSDENVLSALAEQLGYPCTGAEVRKRLNDMKDPTQYGAFVAVRPHGEVVGW